MKTLLNYRKAEFTETLNRLLSNVELAFVCLALPALFLIGIKGNEHSNVKQPSGYEEMYQAPQYGQSVIDFQALVVNKDN